MSERLKGFPDDSYHQVWQDIEENPISASDALPEQDIPLNELFRKRLEGMTEDQRDEFVERIQFIWEQKQGPGGP